MTTNTKRSDRNRNDSMTMLETCPHCGVRLTPWQQVLLRVDRALVCRRCWYRILLDADPEDTQNDGKEHAKD